MKKRTRYGRMPELITDKEFSALIAPLSEMEYCFLEASIRRDGCQEPIVTWHGNILDGHNRYKICQKWNIPYKTVEKPFEDRAEAISWICSNQLGRRNISEETRKYLIGRQFEAEKAIRKRKRQEADRIGQMPHSEEHHSSDLSPLPSSPDRPVVVSQTPRKNPTADLIGDEHHISHSTVEKYSLYSRALDMIGKASPELQERILSGKCKLSYENVTALSRMQPEKIAEIADYLSNQTGPVPFIPYRFTREALDQVKTEGSASEIHPEIKQMPKPDPDAEANRLILTINAWISSIRKTREHLSFNAVSDAAQKKLEEALRSLALYIDSILQMMGGENQNGNRDNQGSDDIRTECDI